MNLFIAIIALFFVPPALWYLGSRAVITSWLWGRYPTRFARFMDCAACTGFWYGLLTYSGITVLRAFLYPPYTWGSLMTISVGAVCGLGSLVWTPMIAFLHDRALYYLGTAVIDESTDAPAPE